MKDLFLNRQCWEFLNAKILSAEIHYRGGDAIYPYWCEFRSLFGTGWAKDGIALRGLSGDGRTPQEAFTNCFKAHAGKNVFFGAHKDGKEYWVQFPIIIET